MGRSRSQLRRRAVLALACVAAGTVLVAAGGDSPPAGADGPVTVAPSLTPAYPHDAPDPDVVRDGSTYYAFTTGTTWGNHIGVLVDHGSSPQSGWTTTTGTSYGSTALAAPPAWETPNTQTSPGVFYWGGRWIMYYDAAATPHAGDTGFDCLAMATAATLGPSAQFTPAGGGPFLCDGAHGGAIDPSPFVDPSTGKAWLTWKTNDGGSTQPGRIWSAELSADGTSLVTAPVQLLFNDTVDHPWQSTVEDPDMIVVQDTYYLLFSGGIWDTAAYGQGYAVCTGPQGPCVQPQEGPILTSYGSVLGPGGGSVVGDGSGHWWLAYAGWTAPCTDYSCGGARTLYVAPISLPRVWPVVGMASTPSGGYYVVSSTGAVDAFDAPPHGSMDGIALSQPVIGMATDTATGGYWLVAHDGGIFAFDAPFYGSTGNLTLNQPIVGMAAAPGGTGYWLVAADGGVFAFGSAKFHGSMGGIPLDQPVVGMAADAATGGYWLVARDGGVFSFDAPYHGSMGGIPLNQPIVAMAAASDGSGYRFVAADGGVFCFNQPYSGSLGGVPLDQPIVGMATYGRSGYWLDAADGGVFSFDAPFHGSAA